ncbi:hypothetical protein [Bacillus alkalicellulosilyticus]|uniref:hypothetical protein n=1 Tax=Alkalihalobacterium alkalicellulosilyticum TaxID=1912214 RepID=UPI0009965F24|nr:hypothetical protein [Bacillus alkalicellulosilyticus]
MRLLTSKQKTIRFLIGFVGIFSAAQMFPSPEYWSWGTFFGELLFAPLSLLGSVVLFILGFLAFAQLVQYMVEQHMYSINKRKANNTGAFILLCYLILWFLHPVASLLGCFLSFTYGIMDAKASKRKKVRGE